MANLIVISQTSLYPKISMVMYVWPASIRLSSLCEWFCGHTSSLTIRFKTPRLSRLSPVSNSTFELPVLSSHVPSSLTFRLRPYFCNSPQTMSLKPLISLDTYFLCPHTSPSLSANPVSWWTLEQWDIEWSQWIIWCRWHRHRPVIMIRSIIFNGGSTLAYESSTAVSISGELDRNIIIRLNRIAFVETP